MAKRQKSGLTTILSIFAVLLVVVGVAGLISNFTGNQTTSQNRFYVKYDNEEITSDIENFEMVVGRDYKFEIGSNVNVYVIPNNTPETAFTYSVNDTNYNYTDMENISKGFSITASDNYFVFKATKDLQDILRMFYSSPLQVINNVPTAINSGLPYFKLVIQSADELQTININFSLREFYLTLNLVDRSINLNNENVSAITFPFEQIILSENNNTISFDLTVADGYMIRNQSYSYKDCCNIKIKDNVCTIILQNNFKLKEDLEYDFVVRAIEERDYFVLVLNPACYDEDFENYITFSTEEIVLTNENRTATFEFYLEDGYVLDDYLYISDGLYSMRVNGNVCTVSLLDNVTLSEDAQYNLLFSVGYDE